MIRIEPVGLDGTHAIAIRNDAYPDIPPMVATQVEFADFLKRCKQGNYDMIQGKVAEIQNMDVMG